jgi:hypothetical protein
MDTEYYRSSCETTGSFGETLPRRFRVDYEYCVLYSRFTFTVPEYRVPRT